MKAGTINEHVGEKFLGGYTQEELRIAFEKVENRENWKGSIYAIVAIADLHELKRIAFAVDFFTATTATFTHRGDGTRFPNAFLVQAPGYYAGPAN